MIPHQKQKIALSYLTDQKTDVVGYGGAAGGAKTFLGCYWLMQLGFYSPETKYFIGRDSLKDTRDSVLFSFQKLAKMIGFDAYKVKENQIIFNNGSIIDFIDLSFYPFADPLYERFGSKEYTCGWIEEAGSVHYMAFEVLKTRIGRWLNIENNIKRKLLVTFNPKKNWVDSTFYRPWKKNELPENIKFVFALPTDNPYLPPDYLEALENIKDEPTRQRLRFGNFDYDDDPYAMIDYKKINALWSNDYVKGGEKYIVSDIARYGSDKAIISVWDGFKIIEYYSFDVSATTKIQNTINAMRLKHKVQLHNVVVDEDGVGGGVVDSLKCKGFVNGGKPFNPNFANLKSECGYKLAELITNIYFEAETSEGLRNTLEQELGQLKTHDADKDGKLKILPKEKIKKNIGRSPDWLDTFIMRMYFEVSNKSFTNPEKAANLFF